MTAMRTEVVALSELLSDPPPVPVQRPIDPDYAESLRLHLSESLAEYNTRTGGRP